MTTYRTPKTAQDSNNQPFSFADRLRAARALIDEAVADAVKSVKEGPVNPLIKRVKTDGPEVRKASGAFIVSASTLFAANNWSVFFHDWEAQYSHVADLLDKGRFSSVRKILADGKYLETFGRSATVFAPEVVARLKTILGDLASVIPNDTLDSPEKPAFAKVRPR